VRLGDVLAACLGSLAPSVIFQIGLQTQARFKHPVNDYLCSEGGSLEWKHSSARIVGVVISPA